MKNNDKRAQGNFITVNGKDKINCSSCNFLGFTQNPDIEVRFSFLNENSLKC